VDPASPQAAQRLIYLAPVLLHPRLIEARRSGAERISGGLEDVVTVNVFARPDRRAWTSLECRAAGTVLTLNVRVALVGFVGGGPCSCTAIHGAIYGHRGGLWAPVMAPVRIVLFVFCVLPPPVQKIAIRRKQLPGSSCNCSRRRLQKLAGSSDCVIQGCTFST